MPMIENSLMILLLWAVLGYLIGSIPFGVVVARVMGLGNLRDIGSGNIGATNVLRTGSKPAAAATLILDAAKGAVVLLLARKISGEDAAQIAALAAMFGHCFPVWLKFQGGKGVATFLGILLAFAWPVGICACIAWLIGAAITRVSSMGGIVSAASSSVLVILLGYGMGYFLCILLTIIVIWRHRENIARIRAGTEPKIGQKG
ncbi:glycerol-3-phosphate 1-O-acyltransferase PlsY [Sulfitobacter donghicola]|uniref:Glycerol-3-phosphate acyltransferase n=1 Tax=Sulfitobacter donghicola DSW-25 = KCTC 12864 = JCM 14565 TaxID=1300350 RepID=A0A073IGQ8_9RHOB|nr:glycerol-3-phosphate 1-O-acyltransferase PlsY [Sulfitobacter donghicola]KEJ88755.1 glycerol-3-phosphate acyltransferase [Sulfitobacter donghicola DSW-25 = KCTC 12864 = JCM 14565]KIN68543.1 Glycerol-3-phosphate acyltransferase [Sulfitobacter donghicola DSW-25 = KCTC 12864 = JCM 14565]